MRQLLVFILLLMSLGKSLGQEKVSAETKIFEVDLSKLKTAQDGDKKLEGPFVIKQGQSPRIILLNPNPLKYDYQIDEVGVDFFAERLTEALEGDSTIFEAFANSSDQTINTDVLSTQISNSRINQYKALNNKIDNLIENLEPVEFNANSKSLCNLISINSNIIGDLDLTKKADQKAAKILLNNNATLYSDVLKSQEEEIWTKLANLDKAFQKHRNSVEQFVKVMKARSSLNKGEFIEDKEPLKDSYLGLVDQLNQLSRKAGLIPDLPENYNAYVKAYIADDVDYIKEQINLFDRLKWDNYTKISTNQYGENTDVWRITIKLILKDDPTDIEEYFLEIWIQNGFKFDISSGIFLTSLLNHEFITQPAMLDGMPLEGKQVIYPDYRGDYTTGVGAMLNVSWRGARVVNPSLNIGGIMTQDQNFQLITGLGLILGKRSRIVLSAGVTMGTVSRLQDRFKADGSTAYSFGDSGEVPTSKVWDFGHYFGVAYNFGRRNTAEQKPKN